MCFEKNIFHTKVLMTPTRTRIMAAFRAPVSGREKWRGAEGSSLQFSNLTAEESPCLALPRGRMAGQELRASGNPIVCTVGVIKRQRAPGNGGLPCHSLQDTWRSEAAGQLSQGHCAALGLATHTRELRQAPSPALHLEPLTWTPSTPAVLRGHGKGSEGDLSPL